MLFFERRQIMVVLAEVGQPAAVAKAMKKFVGTESAYPHCIGKYGEAEIDYDIQSRCKFMNGEVEGGVRL